MGRRLEIKATVGSLAPGGEAVAHVEIEGERRAVFLRQGAPGDVLRAEVDPAGRPARGRVIELLAAGPGRVEPACRWSAKCGGCDWMHLSAGAQADAHVEHVHAALPSAWRDVNLASHPAPAKVGYRTRALLHVVATRRGVVVGMNRPGTHEPVPVETCVVLHPTLDAARASLAGWLEGAQGRGDAQLALGRERRAVLDLRWRGDAPGSCFARLEQAVGAGALAGARLTLGDASRPAVIGEPSAWIAAADDRPLRLAAGGFGQANERVNADLARHVAAIVADWPRGRAVELYAGSGNLSVLLVPRVSELVLVDSSREACDAARENLAARGLTARVVEGDAADYAWGPATELLVLDPPRTGAPDVARRLAASRVKRVVYVSCDPQTLGRDLRLLGDAYVPRSLATFEMFPQTSHVETVVALERRRGVRVLHP